MELFLAPYNVLETKLESNLKTLPGKTGGREEDELIQFGSKESRGVEGHLPGMLEVPSLISNTKEGTSRWRKPLLSCAGSPLSAQFHPLRHKHSYGWVTFLSPCLLGSQISRLSIQTQSPGAEWPGIQGQGQAACGDSRLQSQQLEGWNRKTAPVPGLLWET